MVTLADAPCPLFARSDRPWLYTIKGTVHIDEATQIAGSGLEILTIGALAQNADGSGISIRDATHYAGEINPASIIKIFADTDSAAIAGDNATLWVRDLIGTNQTSSATWSGIRSHLYIPTGKTLGAGFWNCVRGYIETAGTLTLGAATICLSGLEGYFGMTGAITIGAAAVTACVKAIIADEGGGSFTIANELTAGSGKSIGYYLAPSTIHLTHGLFFAKDTCHTYFQLAELGQDADGLGISINDMPHYSGEINPASPIKIFADTDSAAITGDNATFWVRDLIGTTQTSSATWSSIRGHTYIPTGKTLSAGFWNSIRGYVETAGTLTIDDAVIHLTGVEGYLGMTGTITIGAAGRVACLKAIMANEGSAAFSGSGIAAGLLFTTSGITMPNGIYFEGTVTTGINFAGTIGGQGINFDDSTLTISNNMGRNRCYFGVGTYGDHLSLDLSAAATSGDRLYATQLFIDSTANPGHAAMYLQGAYYRINVTTVDQANLSAGVMCPTLDVDYDVKNAYALKAELDMSAAGLAIGQNAFAVSGYLEVATSGALDVSGSSGAAAVTADFAGGTGLTLTGTSRTFALKGNVYSGATATGVICCRVDGSGIVTDGISIECGATATMTNALAFNAMGGMTYLMDFEAIAGFLSTAVDSANVTHKVAVNIAGTPGYIHLFSD